MTEIIHSIPLSGLNTLRATRKPTKAKNGEKVAQAVEAKSVSDENKFTLLYVGNDKDFKLSVLDSNLFNLIYKSNGFLAVNYLQSNDPPDAIITENNLPGMNGFSLHREIQRKIQLHSIPFFVLNTNFSSEERMMAMRQKIDDVFEKPVKPEKISVRINFLRKYKQLRDIETYLKAMKKKITTPLWKRTFDIVFAIVILLMLSPIFLLIILAQQIESFGPVFYSGKRVGAGYNIFPFHKFRTMYVGADKMLQELAKTQNQYVAETNESDEPVYDCPRCKESPSGHCSPILTDAKGKEICEYQYNLWKKRKDTAIFIKIKNDPRVTKVGKFLRKTSLDELPQLFNVIKGEMSIVGNRPIPLYEAEMLTNDKYIERFNAPAGITGLWQVSKRGKSQMSEEERKLLDNKYADNINLFTDLFILFKTPFALIAEEDV